MRKRNKIALFLMLPLAALFWIVGWSLYWIGSSKKPAQPNNRENIEKLSFTVLMPEQKYAE